MSDDSSQIRVETALTEWARGNMKASEVKKNNERGRSSRRFKRSYIRLY